MTGASRVLNGSMRPSRKRQKVKKTPELWIYESVSLTALRCLPLRVSGKARLGKARCNAGQKGRSMNAEKEETYRQIIIQQAQTITGTMRELEEAKRSLQNALVVIKAQAELLKGRS